jgi:hypothetical protein
MLRPLVTAVVLGAALAAPRPAAARRADPVAAAGARGRTRPPAGRRSGRGRGPARRGGPAGAPLVRQLADRRRLRDRLRRRRAERGNRPGLVTGSNIQLAAPALTANVDLNAGVAFVF